MTKDERIARWRDIINEQAKSGINGAVFCREHNLSIPQFRWWRRRFKKENMQNSKSRFMRLVPVPNHHQSGIRICLRDSLSIEVDPGFDPLVLKSVIETIEGERGIKPCSR